jgi:CSLREA domain-containing protein
MKTRWLGQLIFRVLTACSILLLVFSSFQSVTAQVSGLPYGYHDGSEGVVDSIGCSVFGWAVDPDNPDRDLWVQILADGSFVAETTANLYRDGLFECPGGTCGFGLNLWGLISAGEPHLITAQAYDEETSTWANLWNTPKELTCMGYPEGYHDGSEGIVDSNSCIAFGWAVDPDDRDRDLPVRILADEIPVATTVADLLRPDVMECTGGSCGYFINLWDLITTDEQHQITAQVYDEETDYWYDLEATPKMLSCLSSVLYTVNTTDDYDDGACDETHCSLREALNASNSVPSADLIAFNIPGDPPYTIQPQSPLPDIIDPVTIDATTQPGYKGTPVIELEGSNAGEGAQGLMLSAGNSTIRGLMIDSFSENGVNIGNCATNLIEGNVLSGNLGSGIAIAGESATGNVVRGNLIGTNQSGTAPWPNTDGIWLGDFTHNNTLGGTTEQERNIISGNAIFGVSVNSGSYQNYFLGNFIGTDQTGTQPIGNGGGVWLGSGSNNNLVGGLQEGVGNLISGNLGNGVTIAEPGSTRNDVQGNYIGTDVTGIYALGNGGQGVNIGNGASDNLVSGNLISGNTSDGILLSQLETTGTRVLGNYIGMNRNGNAALPNGGDGILLEASLSTIGGTEPGAGNLISGNNGNGIAIRHEAAGNIVQGNYIGTDATGSLITGQPGPAIGEYTLSVEFACPTYGAGTDIDGYISQSDDPLAPWSGSSVHFKGTGECSSPEMLGEASLIYRYRLEFVENTQLTSVAVSGAAFNGPDNVLRVLDEGGEVVGMTNTYGGNSFQTPMVLLEGVEGRVFYIDEFDTSSAWRYRESFTLNGPVSLGNRGSGVIIANGAADNLVGGTVDGAGNLISGNGSDAVGIADPGTTGNRLEGNYIGTDASGIHTLGNNSAGVWIGYGANYNTIGGADPGAGNVISGNSGDAISINDAETTGIVVQGNYIGTNASGSEALPNYSNGIVLVKGTHDNLIAQNLISSNRGTGIIITDPGTSSNTVRDNMLGTDVTGMYALGNGGQGVAIGGGASGELITNNLISANTWGGIILFGDGTEGNTIQANFIGTDITGKGSLGNGYVGVGIVEGASNNLIGGFDQGSGNTIAFNAGAGIMLNPAAGSGNSFLANSIFSNGGLGIDLNEDGVTPNDPWDTDSGPNGLQNYPLLSQIIRVRGDLVVVGILNSTPNTSYHIEFFRSDTCDESGYGEGAVLLGSIDVKTGPLGFAVVYYTLPKNFSPKACLTSTATDSYGNTSEFSKGVSFVR